MWIFENFYNSDNFCRNGNQMHFREQTADHMGEFPEPQRKYAAARENWDVGPSQEGPLMFAINSSQKFLENPDI